MTPKPPMGGKTSRPAEEMDEVAVRTPVQTQIRKPAAGRRRLIDELALQAEPSSDEDEGGEDGREPGNRHHDHCGGWRVRVGPERVTRGLSGEV